LAKQVGGDIINKKNLFIYKAVAFSNQEEAELKRLFAIQPEDSTDKIERVKALLIASTQDAIQDFTFKAFQMLDQMNISDEKSLCLRHLERI
jgi:geranylgeranyl diphosphate synthase type II